METPDPDHNKKLQEKVEIWTIEEDLKEINNYNKITNLDKWTKFKAFRVTKAITKVWTISSIKITKLLSKIDHRWAMTINLASSKNNQIRIS